MTAALPSATIVFTGGPWAWAGLGLALLGALWSVLGYRRRGGGLRRKTLLPLVLRLTALALLALSLAEPAWVGEEAEPGANIVAVIADTSAGLQIKDAGAGETRGEQLAELLTSNSGEQTPWLDTVEETFSLRRFALDDRLSRLADFSALEFEGSSTALGASLQSIARRFAGRPVAALVLLTDGNATDRVDLDLLGDLPPVFPVVVGAAAPKRDLGITAATVSQSSLAAICKFTVDKTAKVGSLFL